MDADTLIASERQRRQVNKRGGAPNLESASASNHTTDEEMPGVMEPLLAEALNAIGVAM